MRLLVTGGSGYIGTRLLSRMVARADVDEVVVVDLKAPKALGPKVRFVQRSVTSDLRDVFTAHGHVDVAVHLAWILAPMHDEEAQREICLGGTRRFLEGCAAGKVGQVLFMSSATAYGANLANTKPLTEDAPLRDRYHFAYSRDKRDGESLVSAFAREHPEAVVQIVRPTIVGGPNVSNYIFRLIGRRLNFRGLGHPFELQLVHEDDVADALVAIIDARRGGAFNLAPDDALPLEEAARLLGCRLLPVPLPLLVAVDAVAWKLRLGRLTEAPPGFIYFVAYPWTVSNRKVKEEVGYRFRYTTRQVLEAYRDAQRR